MHLSKCVSRGLFVFVLALGCTKKNAENASLKNVNTVDVNAPFFIDDPEVGPSKDCSKDNIREISNMPVDHSDRGGKTFRYRYQYIEKPGSETTIVVIPGGPGVDSIGGPLPADNMNIVLIDPRGVGCNFIGKDGFGLKDLTTQRHAQDIVRVLQDLGFKRYILFGSSYGSVVATVAAFEAEKSNLKPHAVVLQGVVGKTFDSGNRQTFDREFKDFLQDYPTLNPAFTAKVPPLNISEEKWAKFFMNSLGTSREQTASIIASALEGNPEKEKELRKKIDLSYGIFPLGGRTFYAAVSCRELFFAGGRLDFVLKDGAMAAVTDNRIESDCAKVERVERKFDPSQYQINAPLYYFQGLRDPNTPLEQAKNHFEVQVSAQKRVWVEVKNGAHVPLEAAEQLGACTQKIWQRIAELEDFNGVINESGSCVSGV